MQSILRKNQSKFSYNHILIAFIVLLLFCFVFLSYGLNQNAQKNDFENTVWFAIVPSINLDEQKNNKNIRQRFKGTNKVEKTNYNTIENL